MCKIFSKQPVEAYTCQTRSVRLSGHATSIRLEGAFWNILAPKDCCPTDVMKAEY